MRKPRKVALISVHDYPRGMYSAYWNISVTGDDLIGYKWTARLFAYEPTAWEHEGRLTKDRPEGVPYPDLPGDVIFKGKPVPQDRFVTLTPADQAEVVMMQEVRRERIAEATEAAPKPVYAIFEKPNAPSWNEVIEATDGTETRDEADAAAQQWVLDRIEGFRRADAVELSDDDVKVLVAEFDRARRQKEYGKCDKMRGMLKAARIKIEEQVSIGYEGDTAWSRGKAKGKAAKVNSVMVMPNPVDVWGAIRDTARELWDKLAKPLLALAYSATARNNRLDELTALIDAGTAGLFRIYDGSRPATCGTATTLLAELTLSATSSAAASGGDLTFNPITADSSANAGGTATWFRIVDSAGTCVIDGDVGTSGSDLNLNSTTISILQEVSVSSAVITEGNA